MALMQSKSGAMSRPVSGLPYPMPMGHNSCRPERASATRVSLRPACQAAARIVPPGATPVPWELCSVGSDVQPALPVTPRTPTPTPTADVSPCIRVSSNGLPWGFAGERDNQTTVVRQISTVERSMTPSYPVRSYSAAGPSRPSTPTQALCWPGQLLQVAHSQRTASPTREVQPQVVTSCSPKPLCQAHSRVGHDGWQGVASDASLATGPGHRASVDSLPFDGSPVSSVATHALHSDTSKESAGAAGAWRSMGTGQSCTGHASRHPASTQGTLWHGRSASAGPSEERRASSASLVDKELDTAPSPSIEDPKESMKVLWSARRVFRRHEGLDSSSMTEEIEAISSPEEPQASMKLLWRDRRTEELLEGTGSSSSSNAEPVLDAPARTRPHSVPRLMNLRKALYRDSVQAKQDVPSTSGGFSSRASLQSQRITGSLGACGSSARQKAPSSARAADLGMVGNSRSGGFYSPRRPTVGRPMPWEEGAKPTDLATAASAAATAAAIAVATASATPSTARSSITPRGAGKGRICTSPHGSWGPVHTLQRAAARGLPGSPRHRQGRMQDNGRQDETRGSSVSPVRRRPHTISVPASNRKQVRCTRPREFNEPVLSDPPKAPKMVPRVLQLGQPPQQQKQQQEQQQQCHLQFDAAAHTTFEQAHRMVPRSFQLGQPSPGPVVGPQQDSPDGVADLNRPSEQRRPSPRYHTSPALRPAPMQAMPGTFGWVPPRKSSGGASPGTVRLKDRCASVISKCSSNELEPTCPKADIPAAMVPVPLHALPRDTSNQDMQKLLVKRRTLGGA